MECTVGEFFRGENEEELPERNCIHTCANNKQVSSLFYILISFLIGFIAYTSILFNNYSVGDNNFGNFIQSKKEFIALRLYIRLF